MLYLLQRGRHTEMYDAIVPPTHALNTPARSQMCYQLRLQVPPLFAETCSLCLAAAAVSRKVYLYVS